MMQWLHVTNTVWWQDFPFRNTKDFLSLFKSSSLSESKGIIDGDFVAHLAGFIATLISCVPSEAHWVDELTWYDFRKASAYLVASVPGIHGCPHPRSQLPLKFQPVRRFLNDLRYKFKASFLNDLRYILGVIVSLLYFFSLFAHGQLPKDRIII